MKCFATRSQRLSPLRRGLTEAVRGHSFRCLASAPVAVFLGLELVLGGCVTRATHQRLLDEHGALQAEKRGLEQKLEYLSAANQSLDEELVRLGEEAEDLRQDRGRLEQRVRELSSAEAELKAKLAAVQREMERRSAELAVQTQHTEELRGTYEGLVADLESQVAAGQIEISQLREGLLMNVSQDILFPPGSAALDAEGRAVLVSVAQRLAELPYRIEVEGHTDAAKIRGSLAKLYPSNWELAGARASSVVRVLLELGIDGDRLSSVSRGEYAPVATNDTPEGRALNRRIEIRLLPDASARPSDLAAPAAKGLTSEPGKESSPQGRASTAEPSE